MEQVVLKGAKPFQKDIGLSVAELGDMSPAFAAVARIVYGAAQGTVPRRTGALAASMYQSSGPTTATVGASAVYADPIHWGWPARNIEANPWISKAAQQSEPTWVREIEAHVDKAVALMDKDYAR